MSPGKVVRVVCTPVAGGASLPVGLPGEEGVLELHLDRRLDSGSPRLSPARGA